MITRRGRDRGSVSLEALITAPVVLLAFIVLVVFGRVNVARGSVESAARDGARQASISRTVGDATEAATASAQAALRREGLNCPARIDVDAAGLDRPPGQNATVTVTVVCVVHLEDIAVPGVPGTQTIRATFSSPVDPLRGAP